MITYENGAWPIDIPILQVAIEHLLSIRNADWRVRLLKSYRQNTASHPIRVQRQLRDASTNLWSVKVTISLPGQPMTWEIMVTIPMGLDPKATYEKLAARAEQPLIFGFGRYVNDDVAKLAAGQVHQVRVIGHDWESKLLWVSTVQTMSRHGKDSRPYYGYVPLDSVGGIDYDIKKLSRYAIGSIQKAIISEIKGHRVRFGFHTEYATTSNKADTFTGIPGQDGTLSLRGYVQSPERVSHLLEVIAISSANLGSNAVVPRRLLIDQISEMLRNRYNAMVIPPQAVATILESLAASGPMPDVEAVGDSFRLADSGWDQLGGYDLYAQASQQEESIAPTPVESPSVESPLVESPSVEVAKQEGRLEILRQQAILVKASLVRLQDEATKIEIWLTEQAIRTPP